MSSNANGSEDGNGADGETTNPRVNHPELESFYRARAILNGISDRALSRATRAIRRSRGISTDFSTHSFNFSSAVAAAAPAASSEATSSLTASSNSLEQLLEQRELHLEQRRGRQEHRERMRQRAERAEARRERSRERRSRRRLRQNSSSENEESATRRIRRAHNVVSSLQDILLVPTSSTLGESTEGGTPRSNSTSAAAATAARPIESQNASANGAETNSNNTNSNNNDNVYEMRRIRRSRSRSRGPSIEARSGSEGNTGDVSGVDTNNSNNANSNDNVARSRRERRRGREARGGSEGINGDDDESDDDDDDDDDSTMDAMDELIRNGTGFELNSQIDRDRLLNNLMQRSITMLRHIEGVTGTQRSTDLKCPVCNEVFCDYEASDHPNFPGNRSGSIRCSHGALTLFTKLHQCPICFEENIEPPNVVALSCGHVLCKEDFGKLGGHVGAERPAGCPKPKPVPPQSTTSTGTTSGTDNNDSSNNNNIFRFSFHS